MKTKMKIEQPFSILKMVNVIDAVGCSYRVEDTKEKNLATTIESTRLVQMAKLYIRNYKYQN